MIFVTVGNPHNPAPRILNAVEDLAVQGYFGDERVVVQSGHNPEFTPRRCTAVPFMDMETFTQHVREARVVICHAGAGSLSHVIRTGKTPVVIPRRHKYGEHIDDHQMELAQAFAQRGLVVVAAEVSELPAAIQEALSRPPLRVDIGEQGRRMIKEAIEAFLQD